MNKHDIVSAIAEAAKLTKKESGEALEAFINVVVSAVKKGDSVTLVGFGTFKAVENKARKGRNPQTGKEIDIPAKKSPKFAAGKAFKESVK